MSIKLTETCEKEFDENLDKFLKLVELLGKDTSGLNLEDTKRQRRLARIKKYRNKNKEKRAEFWRVWYSKNREARLEKARKYREEHREEINRKQREWRKAKKEQKAVTTNNGD